MIEWIGKSDTPDGGGFILQLQTGSSPKEAVIRLLQNGTEVARGSAIECAKRRAVGEESEPFTREVRSFDIHAEEVRWITEQLGLAITDLNLSEEELEEELTTK